jgi:hypothetical protein
MKQILFIGLILVVLLTPTRCLGQPPIVPGDTPIVISDGSVVVQFPGPMTPSNQAVVSQWIPQATCWNVVAFSWKKPGGAVPAAKPPIVSYDKVCANDVVNISLSVAPRTSNASSVGTRAGNKTSITLGRDQSHHWVYKAAFGNLTPVSWHNANFHDRDPLNRQVRIASVSVDYAGRKATRATTLDTGYSVIYVCDFDHCPATLPFLEHFSIPGAAAPTGPKSQN